MKKLIFPLLMFTGIVMVNAQSQRVSAIQFHFYAAEMGQTFTGTNDTPGVIQQTEVTNPDPGFVYVVPENMNNSDYALKEEVKQEEIVAGVIQEELNAGRKTDQTNGLMNLLHHFSIKINWLVGILTPGRNL